MLCEDFQIIHPQFQVRKCRHEPRCQLGHGLFNRLHHTSGCEIDGQSRAVFAVLSILLLCSQKILNLRSHTAAVTEPGGQCGQFYGSAARRKCWRIPLAGFLGSTLGRATIIMVNVIIVADLFPDLFRYAVPLCASKDRKNVLALALSRYEYSYRADSWPAEAFAERRA